MHIKGHLFKRRPMQYNYFIRRLTFLFRLTAVLVLMCVVQSAGAIQRMPEISQPTQRYFRDKAQSYLNSGQPDSAMLCLTVLLTRVETGESGDLPETDIAMSYMTQGALLASVYGNYSEGAVNLIKAQEIAGKTTDADIKAAIAYNLAAMQYEQGLLTGEPAAADTLLNRFAAIMRSLDPAHNSELMIPLLQSVTEISIKEDKTAALGSLFSMVPVNSKFSKSINPLKTIAANVKRGDYDRALEEIDKAVTELSDTTGVMAAEHKRVYRIMRAHLLLKSGHEEAALKAYKELTEGEDAEQHLFSNFEIFSHLQKYFTQKGDSANAIRFRLLEYDAKDRLINRSQSLSTEATRAVYNEQILRQALIEEAAAVRFFRIVVWISGGFLLVLSLLMILLWRKFRQLRESRNIIARNDREYFARGRQCAAKYEVSSAGTQSAASQGEPAKVPTLFERIVEITEKCEEIYEEEFNTARLAELVGVTPADVSSAIMEATGQTTTQFLARTRIREACRRISDPDGYRDYTLEAIGQSVGYRSRSHFGSVFKKFVGMTPSEYASKMRAASV